MKGWIIVFALLALGCAIPWTGNPQVALIGWDRPSGSISYIELASRYTPWKRSALGLSCGKDHNLRLVLRTKLSLWSEMDRLGLIDKGSLIFFQHRQLELPLQITKAGLVDTVTSPKLSVTQLHQLGEFVGSTPPSSVSVQTMETGTYMTGRATNSDLSALLQKCGS